MVEKSGSMKKNIQRLILIPIIFMLIISLSYVALSQKKGRFTIGNEPPYVVINTFAVQDSASNWDSTVFDTHNIDTPMRFNVKDPNPDVLNVRLCIGTMADPSGAGDCNVVNYDFPAVAPGQHGGAQGVQLTYTYNTDSKGTLEGTAAVIEIIPSDCSGGLCSKTYYVDIIVNDNAGSIITSAKQFLILNSVPNTPSLLSPLQTHDQTPDLSWTATDNDAGGQNHWPADTLTYHIQVGALAYGDEDYLADPSAASASATVANPIPWGTPGTTEARTTIYARIWSTDNLLTDSTNYETTLDLVDYLPQIDEIFLSDLAITEDASCTDFIPAQLCYITPSGGTYSSVNIKISTADDDNDCSPSLSFLSNAILCLVDAAGVESCDSLNNAIYNYSLTLTEYSGTSCNFTIAVPSGDSRGIEFFKAPAKYKIYVNASSQAGYSTTLWNYEWEYSELPDSTFPDSVYLGDRITDGGDGIQLGQWNPGLSLAQVINQGNKILGLEWGATDPRKVDGTPFTCTETEPNCCSAQDSAGCWDLTTADDFQIDDDNIHGESTETGLSPQNVPEQPSVIQFNPASGLQVCDTMICDSGINERLNTYFHIMPPAGLPAGEYETTFDWTFTPI